MFRNDFYEPTGGSDTGMEGYGPTGAPAEFVTPNSNLPDTWYLASPETSNSARRNSTDGGGMRSGGGYGTPLPKITNYTGSSSGTTTGTSTSETTATPTVPMPTLTPVDPYTNPAWSKEQIKAYAQEDAALGISEARDALLQGVNKVVSMQGNPTAQAAAMRDLLKGHGSAISKAMQGANKEALSRYQTQYQYQVQEAVTRFDAAQKAAYAKYAADMQNYMATMKHTTTGTSTSTQTGSQTGTSISGYGTQGGLTSMNYTPTAYTNSYI